MKKVIIAQVLLLFCAFAYSQSTVTGTFTELANQQIKLLAFNGFGTYAIDSSKVDKNGLLKLSYSPKDYGMGCLVTADNKSFIVVLSGENIEIKGNTLASPETIKIIAGNENKLFEQYAKEHPQREQALSAWDYLEKIYRLDSLFSKHNEPNQAILKEKHRIRAEDSLFLANLPQNSYVRWYLPVRKLVSSVPTIAQYRTEEIPTAIASFRAMDYTDARLYKSGLLGDVVESHFWLIENSGRSLDSVYLEMKISADCLIKNLLSDENKLNEICEYLFKFLEKRSLFEVSEYLAIKLLNERSCTINNDFADQLESYRAMKKGNTAPDIEFKGDVFAPAYETGTVPKMLSAIKSDYTVVIFGASWCPQCPTELSQMLRSYPLWKAHKMEVVFVSLDESNTAFKSFTSVFPFISVCDYKKWGSPIAKNYHVFATPTIFLLNNKREILLRPGSVSQLDAWVDWYLVKGNK